MYVVCTKFLCKPFIVILTILAFIMETFVIVPNLFLVGSSDDYYYITLIGLIFHFMSLGILVVLSTYPFSYFVVQQQNDPKATA